MARISGGISNIDDSEYMATNVDMPRTQHGGIGRVIVKDLCRSSPQQPLSLACEAGENAFTDLPALSRCSSQSSISSLPTPTIDLSIFPTSQGENVSISHDLFLLSHYYQLPQIGSQKAIKSITIMPESEDRSAGEIELTTPSSFQQPLRSAPTFKDWTGNLPERQRRAREAQAQAALFDATNDEYDPFGAAFGAALTAIRNNQAQQHEASQKQKRWWGSIIRKLVATCDKNK